MARICEVDGCDNIHWGRGFCKKHHTKWRRYGDPLAGETREAREAPAIECIATPTTWQAEAACKDLPPELFFLDVGESGRQAKTVCRACPVRAECLEYALEANEDYGIWGGMTERERRRIRHQRARGVITVLPPVRIAAEEPIQLGEVIDLELARKARGADLIEAISNAWRAHLASEDAS